MDTPLPASLEVTLSPSGVRVRLLGLWDHTIPQEVVTQLFSLASKMDSSSTLFFSLKQIQGLDYSGAVLLLDAMENLKAAGVVSELVEIPESFGSIFKMAYASLPIKKSVDSAALGGGFFEKVGRALVGSWRSGKEFATFLGEVMAAMAWVVRNPRAFRMKAVLYHIEESAIKATLIVMVASFMVGFAIAYQGALQLEQFGAAIIAVEMTGMLTLRELGPVIAAIIVAGRSASSYAAQIGVMKITEEIDAMRTMNFNPYLFLVLPRVIALTLSLPLVVFVACVAGVLGEMLIMKIYMNLSFSQYMTRFLEMVEIRHLWVGLIKAPFYGAMIALVGCFRGFQITDSTESVGLYTTISVVNALFWIFALNAVFSLIFPEFKL